MTINHLTQETVTLEPETATPERIGRQGFGFYLDETLGALYRILIHNDDVTPFDYVIHLLGKIFLLSDEIAEHIAVTAHQHNVAVVLVRPQNEAEKLIGLAHAQARLDDFPLTFSLEPNE